MYNLSGGIKAWKKEVAVGPEDSGLFLFGENDSPVDAVITGFGLEAGLHDFYLSMIPKVDSDEIKKLFQRLAEIEVLHQQQLLGLYTRLTGNRLNLQEFSQKIVSPAMEGGLTTKEYLDRYGVDYESELEVLSLALAIEAQALDLYLRAGNNSGSEEVQAVLFKIAEEERAHIKFIGHYIDQLEIT